MKNAIYLILAIGLTLYSCSDNDENNPAPSPNLNPQTENPYKTGKDLSSSKWKKWTNTGNNEDYSMLGYGYDATGKYAHPAWVKAKIFDVDKYKANKSNGVTLFQIRTSSSEINFSGTKAECLNDLAWLAGFTEAEASL